MIPHEPEDIPERKGSHRSNCREQQLSNQEHVRALSVAVAVAVAEAEGAWRPVVLLTTAPVIIFIGYPGNA